MILVFILIENVQKIRRGCRAQPKAVSEYIILLSNNLRGIRICIEYQSVCHRDTYYRDRRPMTSACLACWAMDGDKGIEIVYGEEKIFCTGPPRAAKAEQKSLVPARQGQRTNQGKTPFYCILRVPIHLRFNSQQGPLLSIVSGLSFRRNWAPPEKISLFFMSPHPLPRKRMGGGTQFGRLNRKPGALDIQGGSDISGTLSKLSCCFKKKILLLILLPKTI
jgi:hypothetical protein